MRFRWDYADGWGKDRKGGYWKTFKNRCRAYDGPPLPMLVAACRAPNGSYWTVQAWQRRLPLLGFDPWLPHHTNWELHLAHFSGELPRARGLPQLDVRWSLAGRYGAGWKRESGILTHRGTGTFCHSFVPQRPFAGYPSQDVRPAAAGECHRITVGGPGVLPVMQVEVPGLTRADLQRDDEFDSMFVKVMAGDRICAGER